MKEGWEKKKLGDICDTMNGLWTGKKPPFINIQVISLKSFTKDCQLKHEFTPIEAEVKHFQQRKLQYGDIIVEKSGGSDTQPVGRPVFFDIKEGDYSFCNFTSALRVKDANIIKPNYLHKCLLSFYRQGVTLSLQSKTTGIHNLDFKGYLNLSIPVPPLSVQESIVSELDMLSGIISKHKALQEEYDRLEQSIFYDMFGDPVTNEKGWEVKKLGEVAEKCFAGGDKPSDYREFETEEYRYPIIGNGEGERGILGYSKDFKVDKDSVTIGARGASIGNCRICTFKFTPVIRLITIIPSEKINVVYLFTIAKMLEFNISGAGQAQLTVPNVINKLIPLPPLSLQQSFADKISAIEQMKAKNKAAQEEAEMLFNERMAYYF